MAWPERRRLCKKGFVEAFRFTRDRGERAPSAVGRALSREERQQPCRFLLVDVAWPARVPDGELGESRNEKRRPGEVDAVHLPIERDQEVGVRPARKSV